MLHSSPHQGFTLIELLVALVLTSLLAVLVAQYLVTSTQVRHLMQQERLAATAAEDLAIQMHLSSSPPGGLTASLVSGQCSSHPQANLDFTGLCQASQSLPQLRVQHQAHQLTLEWLSPVGLRSLSRPTR